MDLTGHDYPMPECECGSKELRTEGDVLVICVGCGAQWELTAGVGWARPAAEEPAEAPAEEPEPEAELTCLYDDCPGIPEVYNPSPGSYAMRCPDCYMSGPVKASPEEALDAWMSMLAYGGGEDEPETEGEPEATEAQHVHAPFAMAVHGALHEMREEHPSQIKSCEEGATYLKMRQHDFWDWLKPPPSERDLAQGLNTLVYLAATAQRVAEDRDMTQILEPYDSSAGDETTE